MCARLKGVREVHACEMNEALCAVAREAPLRGSFRGFKQKVISSQNRGCPITVHPTVTASAAACSCQLQLITVSGSKLLYVYDNMIS